MNIHLHELLHMMPTAMGSFAEFIFAKFSLEDRIFGDLSLDVENA